jgi:hypothetical protein
MLLAAVIEVPLIEVIEVLLLIPTCAFPNNPAVAQELLCRELDDVNRRGIVKYKDVICIEEIQAALLSRREEQWSLVKHRYIFQGSCQHSSADTSDVV